MKKEEKEPIYAILYARVAREGEGSAESVEEQLKDCMEFAKARGFILDEKSIYMDTNSGVGRHVERPGLNDILKQIDESPERTFVLIVKDKSRIARDYEQYESFSGKLASRGVPIESTKNSYDENPEEQFKKEIAWAIGRYDYNIRHERAVEAIRRNKKN